MPIHLIGKEKFDDLFPEFIKYLEKKGRKQAHLTAALAIAVQNGLTDFFGTFMAHGAALKTDEQSKDLIHIACETKQIKTAIALLSVCRDIDEVTADENSESALHIACRSGSIDIVKFLLQREADIELLSGHNKTPLMIACEHGHYDIVKELIERGASLAAAFKNMNDESIQAIKKQKKVLKYLKTLNVDFPQELKLIIETTSLSKKSNVNALRSYSTSLSSNDSFFWVGQGENLPRNKREVPVAVAVAVAVPPPPPAKVIPTQLFAQDFGFDQYHGREIYPLDKIGVYYGMFNDEVVNGQLNDVTATQTHKNNVINGTAIKTNNPDSPYKTTPHSDKRVLGEVVARRQHAGKNIILVDFTEVLNHQQQIEMHNQPSKKTFKKTF